MKPKTDNISKAVNELSETYSETAKNLVLMRENLKEVKSLYDNGYGNLGKNLISLGVTLVLFPEPTLISDAIGCGVIGVGCLYNRLSPPQIFVDDIYKVIDNQIKEIFHNDIGLSKNFVIPIDFNSLNFSLD